MVQKRQRVWFCLVYGTELGLCPEVLEGQTVPPWISHPLASKTVAIADTAALAALLKPSPMLSRDAALASGAGAEALSEKFLKITRRVWALWGYWSLNKSRFSGSAVAGHELQVAAMVSQHPGRAPPGAGRDSGQREHPSPAPGIRSGGGRAEKTGSPAGKRLSQEFPRKAAPRISQLQAFLGCWARSEL